MAGSIGGRAAYGEGEWDCMDTELRDNCPYIKTEGKMTDIVDTRENAGCVLPAGQLLHRTCGPAQSLHFAFRLDKGTVIPQKTHPCNPIPLPRTLGSSNFYRSIPRGILAGGSVFDLLGGYFCAVLGDDIYVQGLLDLIFYLLKQQYPLFPFIVGHSPYQSHPPPPLPP